jgi:cell division protein FtsB
MTSQDLIQIGLWMAGAGLGLLGKLVMNIAALNKNIAVIVERVDSHEKRIDRLETNVSL